jgi:hypothetical protein
MEPQRLGSAAGGGIIGALIGVLVSIWWLDSAPVGTTVAYATAIGAVLGVSLGTRPSEWLGDLLTSLW